MSQAEIIEILQNKLVELRKQKSADIIDNLEHQIILLKQEIEDLKNPPKPEYIGTSKQKYYQEKIKEKTVYCGICDCTVKYNSYSNHIKSKLHKKCVEIGNITSPLLFASDD
jgi:hypothetical protein